MASVFRFSNPVSDIDKFISTYKSIYEHFKPLNDDGQFFDNDLAGEFLAKNGLASSLGAVGEEALRRSRRDDRSRDPLYNQHKAYSEMFRMLGWYEPGDQQTNYKLSEYGEYIADAQGEQIRKHFECNTLHIVGPNPLTNVKGGNILRPFPLILKLMNELDGYITTEEMVMYVLGCANDKSANYIENSVREIRQLRADGDNRFSAYANSHGVQKSTLTNYTRMPIAIIKWLGWATAERCRLYGGRKINAFKLTDYGYEKAQYVNNAIDIRFNDLEKYKKEEIVAFCLWANLYQLDKLGYNLSDYSDAIIRLEASAKSIFSDFEIQSDSNILFFPYQEAPRDILAAGDELLESI
jgi:hypothetical protein